MDDSESFHSAKSDVIENKKLSDDDNNINN